MGWRKATALCFVVAVAISGAALQLNGNGTDSFTVKGGLDSATSWANCQQGGCEMLWLIQLTVQIGLSLPQQLAVWLRVVLQKCGIWWYRSRTDPLLVCSGSPSHCNIAKSVLTIMKRGHKLTLVTLFHHPSCKSPPHSAVSTTKPPVVSPVTTLRHTMLFFSCKDSNTTN